MSISIRVCADIQLPNSKEGRCNFCDKTVWLSTTDLGIPVDSLNSCEACFEWRARSNHNDTLIITPQILAAFAKMANFSLPRAKLEVAAIAAKRGWNLEFTNNDIRP